VGCIVQISDTHFGTERAPVVRDLTTLVRGLAPELVVFSGDITQRATDRQFAAARAFAAGLGAPVLAIPGNHDIPLLALGTRLLRPYGRYSRAFGEVLEPEHASPGWLVLGVKTTRRWRHKHGQVSAAQIARVADRLVRAPPAQLRLVVVHQPVAVPERSDARDLLRGHAHAVRDWAAAGADVILGGHIHLPFVQPLHETHPLAPGRRLWCVQAGTAVSSRVRPPAGNSVNVLRRHFDGVERALLVERWDHVAARARFERVASDVLPLGKAPSDG